MRYVKTLYAGPINVRLHHFSKPSVCGSASKTVCFDIKLLSMPQKMTVSLFLRTLVDCRAQRFQFEGCSILSMFVAFL